MKIFLQLFRLMVRNSVFFLKMGVTSVCHQVSEYVPIKLILVCLFSCLGKWRMTESACLDFFVVVVNKMFYSKFK